MYLTQRKHLWLTNRVFFLLLLFDGDLVLECVVSEIMPSVCCHCELVKEGNSVFLMLSMLNKKVATRLLGNTNIYRLIDKFEHLLQWYEMSGCFQLIS